MYVYQVGIYRYIYVSCLVRSHSYREFYILRAISLAASTTMVFKAKKVAVIGAGVSGLASAKHLKAAGLEIVIYERSSVSGGVWCVNSPLPSHRKANW
jgi:ribulose 1,5-bisphosphate synthetase/thiazole synthase